MERKPQVLGEYRTQLIVDGDTIVHSGGQREPISSVEVFRAQETPRDSGVEWTSLGMVTRVATCLIAVLLGGIIDVIGTINYQFAWTAISLGIVSLFLADLGCSSTHRSWQVARPSAWSVPCGYCRRPVQADLS